MIGRHRLPEGSLLPFFVGLFLLVLALAPTFTVFGFGGSTSVRLSLVEASHAS